MSYPTYARLLQREGKLAGTSWELFPDKDRGTPSFITPEVVMEAKSCIRTGTVFGLDYPADAFDPGMSLKRGAPRHIIYSAHPAHRDDYLDGYYLHAAGEPLGLDLIRTAIEAQSVTLKPGDILMLHTGWCEWFLGLPAGQKQEVRASRKATGVEQSEEFVAWAWDNQLSVLAADNFAFECLPAVPDSPFRESAPNDDGMMHQQLLAKLGMPLGELWKLGPLARHLRTVGHWEAFVSIKPLNIVGGTGSPANATALT